MKLVYTGEIYPHHPGTCFQRMRVLQDFGMEVTPVCIVPHSNWGGRLLGAPFRRLQWGPNIEHYNEELVRTVRHVQPRILWVDKGVWVKPETIQRLKVIHHCTVVHYTPDPALTFHKSRHFRKSIPHYDLLVTTKAYEMGLYRQHGAKELLLQTPSFDKRVHFPVEPTPEEWEKYGCDAVFGGTYGPGREKWLRPIAEMGIQLAIWGNGWEHCNDPVLQPYIKHEATTGRGYALSLRCAKIGLGMLSPLVPDRSTTRTLEIPACGTFLLAERTEEHERLFEEGVEAEYFSTEFELQHKIQHFLEHEDEREKIARAGYERCWQDNNSSHDKVQEILKTLQCRGIIPAEESLPLPTGLRL